MDFNDYLLNTFLPYGSYDTKQIKISKKRIYINHLIRYICYFCAFKDCFIILTPYYRINFMDYLIDIILINNELNKVVTMSTFLVYLTGGLSYKYYDLDQFLKYYHLKLDPTKKFIKKANTFRMFMWIVILSFDIIFIFMIYRCLSNSYQIVHFYYFIFISIPLGIVTLIAYFCINHSILAISLLQLCTIEFLILRLQSIGEDISGEFNYTTSKLNRQILNRKKYFNLLKYLKIINDIILQQQEINKLFDSTTGRIYAASLFGALIYPSFFFFPNPIYIRLIYVILYCCAVGFNCVFVSYWNGKFIYQIKRLKSTIHLSVCKFENFKLKNLFNNFLILNNEHKHISFTFLNENFDLDTNALLEYMNHSISLAFMVYQAASLGPPTNSSSNSLKLSFFT